MAGPVEILIVVGVFGVIGLYLYVASRFIRVSEQAAAETEHFPPPSTGTAAEQHRRHAA